ncbi:MAG: valine--tRNA ligase [bacterium]
MAKILLDKVYDPKKVEDKWYKKWEESNQFTVDSSSKKPSYTIVIPPPNVTGMLTMGHILNNTIQDLLIRWKRMDGCEALWLPGTDHAGIATQNKVEAALKEEGLTRYDLGRKKLIGKVWEWKEKYGGIILQQLRELGASCDWSRERFTMDEGLSNAVKEVFIRLFEKGLIYRGRRLINWCPRCKTALANEEVSYIDKQGKFWDIAYPIQGSEKFIIVSTTRPETMLGDTAVAVHPEDKRYKNVIGKTAVLPLMDRHIPVIADEHADPDKGSGAVKITPAHDFDDFEVGVRHNLKKISVIDEDGKINKNGGNYKGLDRFEARKKILQDLEELSLLRGEAERITPTPHCYRCDTVVEPFLSQQWFVKMKPLAEPAIEAVKNGKIRFYPEHWEETYFHWMENIQDWCISRQIWWGHRIPVWTCENNHSFVSREEPETCPECGSSKSVQDPDVLDTWFSSWLWPFSTLGWPKKTEDLKKFFPTDTLVTGPDIIFFWVARMIMASLEFMGDIPFKEVYFNGMIRDMSGRKMSKSLGNSPDPLWLINGISKENIKEFISENPTYKKGVPAYGADAVRMTMVYLTPLGGDINFDHTLVEFGQKFCNKLWNACRFVLMNLNDDFKIDTAQLSDADDLIIYDKWILSRLQYSIAKIRKGLDSFRFNDATRVLYDFVWGDFCDWYLELTKFRLYKNENYKTRLTAQEVLVYVLQQILKLLHPFMPFISEEIWQAIREFSREKKNFKSIMYESYPEVDNSLRNKDIESEITILQDTVSAVREIRGEMNIAPHKEINLLIRGKREHLHVLNSCKHDIAKLAQADYIKISPDIIKPDNSATAVIHDLEIFIPLKDIIDLKVERERIEKEMNRLQGLLQGITQKLQNEQFINKAPEKVVEKEKKKQINFQEKFDKLQENLKMIS